MSKRDNYLLTSGIKIAYSAKNISISLPIINNKSNLQLIKILQQHGIIKQYKRYNGNKTIFQIHKLAYENPKSTIKFFQRNQKIYINTHVLRNYYGSLPKHIFILNTKCGIITSIEAQKKNIGGYIVGSIY